MKDYRFKTEIEFEEEFGSNWKNKVNWNSEGKMDYLFGKYVIEYSIEGWDYDLYFRICIPHNLRSYTRRLTWNVNPKMLTQKPLPKYDEDNESLIHSTTVDFGFLI